MLEDCLADHASLCVRCARFSSSPFFFFLLLRRRRRRRERAPER